MCNLQGTRDNKIIWIGIAKHHVMLCGVSCRVCPGLDTPRSVLHQLLFILGGEVVTSRYFHRKAVLSTLDQLGKTKTHTRKPAKDTAHKTILPRKFFFVFFVFLFFPKHTDIATGAHIGYSIMHSRLRQPAVSTPYVMLGRLARTPHCGQHL
jgi:hypothetical protein